MRGKTFRSVYWCIGVLIVLLMVNVSAIELCIDLDDPSPPASLSITYDDGFVSLAWGVSSDEPDCSDISEYVVSFEGNNITRVNGSVFSFVDVRDLGSGTYTYSVYAVDMGGNEGNATANTITIGGSVYRGGSSSSSSYVCVEDWSCDEWSECIGNDMRRLCSDLNECGTENDKPDVYQECGESSGGDDMIIENDVDEADVGGVGGFFSAITGAVVGGGAGSVASVGILLLLVLGGFFIVIKRRKMLRKIIER